MSKKRMKSALRYYEGKRKNENGIWVIVGTYKTPEEAFKAGCGKVTPRYSRVAG